MPKEKAYEYTNKSGNHCTTYSDGSYAYKNASGSSYYDTGKGHAFYKWVSSQYFCKYWWIEVMRNVYPFKQP